jgi:large subunit ribosomal protein L35
MPKMKTNRAAAKRFKRTASGKFKRGRAYSRHHLQLKTRKQKRRLHSSAIAKKTEKRQLQKLLPYGA